MSGTAPGLGETDTFASVCLTDRTASVMPVAGQSRLRETLSSSRPFAHGQIGTTDPA